MYQPLAGASAALPKQFWIKQAIQIFFMLFAYYFNAYYLVPRLLIKNKMLLFIACIIAWCLLSSFLLARVDGWLDLPKMLERAFGKRHKPNHYFDFFSLTTTLLVLGISTSVSMMQRWTRDLKLRQEFESQRTVAELSFLKAQINPHFFFNTLNSIYALTYIDVETSRQALHKLSRMMRYLLYETQQDMTMLSKEIAFIKDYVEIMKLRLNTNTIVLFTIPESLTEMPIAPMLLLPFVENAFKHGVDDQETSIIKVSIAQLPAGLLLTVINNVVKRARHPDKEIEDKGIGLVNTCRRLDLLYPDKYVLNINNDSLANQYKLHLQLTLV